MNTDKRQFNRVAFAARAFVEHDGRQEEAVLMDVSLKGALLEFPTPTDLALGESCTVSVRLESTEIVITFTGEVAHTRDNLVGLKLVTIDIDSMIHLRSLIELNTADPDQVKKELSFLAKPN